MLPKLPKGPRTFSFFQLFQWALRPSDFLDTCTQRYGNIFTAQWSGFSPSVFVSDPEALEQVLTAPTGQFESGQGNKIFQPFVGDYSMMLLDGRPHQRQRQLVSPPFMANACGSTARLPVGLRNR
jgi:cytochrome P450 family 110